MNHCKSTYLVESMIVLSRCAMVITVESLNSLRMVCWIRSSVSKSTAAVASSRMRILVFRRSARARQTNCRCPTLNIANENNSEFIKLDAAKRRLKLLASSFHLLQQFHAEGLRLAPSRKLSNGQVPRTSRLSHRCTCWRDPSWHEEFLKIGLGPT